MALVLPGEEVTLNEPGRRFARHHHRDAYVALLVSGTCEEAGDCGRFLARPGDVLVHRSFEAHQDTIGRKGALFINLRVDGSLCVLEEFRIPSSFDPASVRVFNTNGFHFDARALADLDIPWTYFRVTKKVDGQPVIQFERLVNEVTSFLPSRYLLVPRSGAGARFLPVKDHEELAQRRGEIELVARSRGMI